MKYLNKQKFYQRHCRQWVTLVLVGFFIVALSAGVPSQVAHADSDRGYRSAEGWRTQQVIYQTGFDDQYELIRLLNLLLQLLQTRDGLVVDFEFDTDRRQLSDPEIMTVTPRSIEDTEAVLRGRITDFNRADYVDVWFEYGDDNRASDWRTRSERIYDDEDEDFERRVTGLRDDTVYYYRAVGEGENGGIDRGSIRSFRTDDRRGSRFEDDPFVTTRSAVNIDDESAGLRGTVTMRDARNGEVFFVYGEDRRQVEDVTRDFDSYADVDEDGEDLQKVRVDTDLDDQDSYEEEVDNLDDNTRHYFRLCVGYEDEDNDEVLMCGGVRSFTTD